MLEQEELEWVLGISWGVGCGSPSTSQGPGQLLICCLHRHQQCSDVMLSLSCLFPSQLHTLVRHGSKPEMIALATKNARLAAQQFANDSGSKVGEIKKATQGLFSVENAAIGLEDIKSIRVVTQVEYQLR